MPRVSKVKQLNAPQEATFLGEVRSEPFAGFKSIPEPLQRRAGRVKVICNTCQKRQVFVYKGDNYKHCKQCLCMGKMKSDPRKPCIYPKKFRKFCQNCHDGN